MNSNDYAFPFAEQTMKGHQGTKEGECGLTKREYIATKAMASIMIAKIVDDPGYAASLAVEFADALIKQLAASGKS